MKLIERHPLGFTKLSLPLPFGFRVRLHLWFKGAPRSEDRHNHRWSFVSLPLWGHFAELRYAETRGERFMKLDCRPDRGEGRRYTPASTSGLVPIDSCTRKPLRFYRCRRGEIHSFRPLGSGFHASLVFLGRPQRPSSDVWKERDHG